MRSRAEEMIQVSSLMSKRCMNPQFAFNVVVAAGIWGWVEGFAFEFRGAGLLHRWGLMVLLLKKKGFM